MSPPDVYLRLNGPRIHFSSLWLTVIQPIILASSVVCKLKQLSAGSVLWAAPYAAVAVSFVDNLLSSTEAGKALMVQNVKEITVLSTE